MKKTKTLLLSATLSLCSFGLLAQKGPVAAGGDAEGPGGTVSFSIGQIDYITATGTGGRITQGIQQPYEIFRVSVDELDYELFSSVYPNPTRGELTLRVPADAVIADLSYRIFDITGKMVAEKKLDGPETAIEMTSLANATYLLIVYNKVQDLTTFKIIKNQ